MSDVRLTATNPDDSSVVPVSCNARGELLTVAPVIEKIPNDVEIEGDLTVTGTINGDNGGSGLPEPLGPEGSILAIENGAPAWVGKSDLCAPDQPPEDQVILKKNNDANSGYAISIVGEPLPSETDINAFLRTLPTWENPSKDSVMGFGKSGTKLMSWDIDVKSALGKVLHFDTLFTFSCDTDNLNGGYSYTCNIEVDTNNLQPIRNAWSEKIGAPSPYPVLSTFSWLVGRDNITARFQAATSGFMHNGFSDANIIVQRWRLEDPADYLMRNYIAQQQKLQALEERIVQRLGEVGSTTDIDLLR
jgi:hypothetical protein